MKNIYYIIWSDAIRSMKKNHPNDKFWKFKIFTLITWANTANLWIVIVWLKYFYNLKISIFEITFIGSESIDGLISFIISFSGPFIILNYFLVFHKRKYISILEKFPTTKYRWSGIYTIVVMIIALITVFFIGALQPPSFS
jgi:hypothetical protein